MLEKLKTILGDAYTEEIGKAITGEIGKNFVAKANYDQRNTAYKELQKQLADRDIQLEDLKKVDTSAMTAKIEELQNTNKTQMEEYEKKIVEMKMNYALDTAITASGGLNLKAIKALLDTSKLALKEDGTVEGLTDQIDILSKASDSAMLFGKSANTIIDGFHPAQSIQGGTGGKNPKDMSYSELSEYMNAHPDFKLE